VNGASFFPDGTRVVTASEGRLRTFAVAGGALLATVDVPGLYTASVSPDGRFVAVARWDGIAEIRRAGDGALVRTLVGPNGLVRSAAWSADSRRLVTGHQDGSALVWNVESGALLGALEGHGASVGAARFSRDGNLVATAGDDQTVRLWDAAGFRMLAELPGHRGRVSDVVFVAGDDRLVSSGEDETLKTWNVARDPRRDELAQLVSRAVAFGPTGTPVDP
jgi:WD40 repeat protein